MLRLRPYKTHDAETIVSWCKDELSFRRWTSDRYGSFPITATDMNDKYENHNGDCVEPDNFYPMTAFDESGVVGHLIMRFTDKQKAVLRLGFVIVDDAKRGKGYGKEMLRLANKFAFEILKAKRVTLGVFESNLPAYRCYKASGFQDVLTDRLETYQFSGEVWNILELEMTAEEFNDQ